MTIGPGRTGRFSDLGHERSRIGVVETSSLQTKAESTVRAAAGELCQNRILAENPRRGFYPELNGEIASPKIARTVTEGNQPIGAIELEALPRFACGIGHPAD